MQYKKVVQVIRTSFPSASYVVGISRKTLQSNEPKWTNININIRYPLTQTLP